MKKLDKIYFKIIPFDMAFNEVHTENYDPQKNIEKFWTKYNINESRDLILSLLCTPEDDENKKLRHFDQQQKDDFSLDLFRALIGYYLVHYMKWGLEDIDIPLLPTGTLTEEEVKFSQINYALFGKK